MGRAGIVRWAGREDDEVSRSVLEAIKQGDWYFEPVAVPDEEFDSTGAVPGSSEKLSILADRVRDGLPLWHARDRRDYDEEPEF
jgi:hypothetical protein